MVRLAMRKGSTGRRWLAAIAMAGVIGGMYQESWGFDFFGKRRTETSDGGVPNPFFWSDLIAPIKDGVKTLTVSFNTAANNKKVSAAVAAALQAVVNSWQRPHAPTDAAPGNIGATIPAGSPTIKSKATEKIYDTQSVLVHELGHALGLDHPNLGDRVPRIQSLYANSDDFTGNGTPRAFVTQPGPDGLPGTKDDVRGGNRSLVLSDVHNNPFNKPPDKIDRTTFKLDRADNLMPNISTQTVAEAPKAATGFDPITSLTSVMAAYNLKSGTTVRNISWDDWAGVRYLEAGRDQTSGNADDYQFNLVFNAQGSNAPDNLLPQGVNILISMNPDLPEDRLGHSIPNRVGQAGIVGDIIELTLDPETDEVLAMAAIWLDGPEDSLGTNIVFVDVFLPGAVPEPGTLAILGVGVAILIRRRTRHF